MRNNRYSVWINLWLLVSLLISFNVPSKARADSRVFSNNPPYIIRGRVYTYGTSDGLADAQVKVEFEVCDDPISVPRAVVLPRTGARGGGVLGACPSRCPACAPTHVISILSPYTRKAVAQ